MIFKFKKIKKFQYLIVLMSCVVCMRDVAASEFLSSPENVRSARPVEVNEVNHVNFPPALRAQMVDQAMAIAEKTSNLLAQKPQKKIPVIFKEASPQVYSKNVIDFNAASNETVSENPRSSKKTINSTAPGDTKNLVRAVNVNQDQLVGRSFIIGPVSDYLNGVVPVTLEENPAYQNGIVDYYQKKYNNNVDAPFLALNQDITELDKKIAEPATKADPVFLANLQALRNNAISVKNQMNSEMIQVKFQSSVNTLLQAKDFSLQREIELSNQKIKEMNSRNPLIINQNNQSAALIEPQNKAVVLRIDDVLLAAKNKLDSMKISSVEVGQNYLVKAQQELTKAIKSTETITKQENSINLNVIDPIKAENDIYVWRFVEKQLKINLNNQIIFDKNVQAEVAKLTPIVKNASDPINFVLQNIEASFDGKNEAISAGIKELKGAYDSTIQKNSEIAIEHFVTNLEKLSSKYSENIDLKAYSDVVGVLKSKFQASEKLKVAIDHYINDILANDQAVHANIDKINGMLKTLKQRNLAASLSPSDKSGLDDLLKSKNGSSVSDITTVGDLIALYEQVLPKLEAKKIGETEGTTLYQSINAAASGIDYVVKSVVGSKDSGAVQQEKVETALHVFVEKVCTLQGLAYGSVSAVGLTTIAAVIREMAFLLISIQNNSNLTVPEKNKKEHELLQLGMMDIAYIIAADKTGADINVLASGNVESIATNAGFNKVINMLNPNDPYSYSASADPGIYMHNINNFKAQYVPQQNVQQGGLRMIDNNVVSGSAYSNSYTPSAFSYNASTYPSYEELMAMGG